MTHIFIDTEYCYTCALREGMLPNYKAIVDMFNNRYPENTIYAYFVGDKEKKKGVSMFLTKLGVKYNIIMDIEHISKTQIVGSQMAIDTTRLLLNSSDDKFVFLSGDDYLIPIIELVYRYNIVPDVYYFPLILSKYFNHVDSRVCRLNKLGDGFLLHQKEQ